MIHHGDLFDVLPTLEAESIDACVTDPPYDLTANKRGGSGAASLNLASPAGRSRISTGGGFMGKEWDGQGVAFKPETWQAVYRVLKPGAHLCAFGGTRTFHRMTCAIEDAGFEIRDCLSWLYGSGFPKSLDVSKALDKIAGAEREVVGVSSVTGMRKSETWRDGSGLNANVNVTTLPSTDAAKQWDGWGTALKPSHEPVVCARKPLSIQHELAILVPKIQGSIWSLFNASDVAKASMSSPLESGGVSAFAQGHANVSSGSSGQTDTPALRMLAVSGFWSIASLLSDYLSALSVHANMFTTETASSLITDLKILKSCLSKITQRSTLVSPGDGCESDVCLAVSISRSVLAKCERLSCTSAGEIVFDWRADEGPAPVGGDFNCGWEPIILARKPLQGTVAANVQRHGTGAINIDDCRIDYSSPDDLARTMAGVEAMSRTERDKKQSDGWARPWQQEKPRKNEERVNASGRWPANVLLDECAAQLLDEMTGELHSGAFRGVVQQPRLAKSKGAEAERIRQDRDSDFGGASRFYYVAKPSKEERNYGTDRNGHPTVKPIEVIRWLVKLITPPEGTVLDPFMGSGTTGMACRYEQRAFLGIEREAEYFAIAKSRIEAVAPLFAEVV